MISGRVLGLIFFLSGAQLSRGQMKYVFERPAMGSPFTITIYGGADSAEVERAAAEVFRKVDTLNGLLSDYIDSSEINRLSATSGQGRFVVVSPPLFDILWR